MMQIGTVIHAPKISENAVLYDVSIEGEEFTAESEGKQAVKDYLFVREGQSIEIEGDIINRQIEVIKAKIDILDIANMQ